MSVGKKLIPKSMNRLYRLQTVSVDLADDPTAICVCAASGDPGGVKSKIISEIQQVGPLPFERFMAMALYDPDGGFFAAGELRSVKGGDFLTSPEVSPMFGEAIGRLVESEIDSLEVLLKFDARQRRDSATIDKGGWLHRGRCANALVLRRTTSSCEAVWSCDHGLCETS